MRIASLVMTEGGRAGRRRRGRTCRAAGANETSSCQAIYLGLVLIPSIYKYTCYRDSLRNGHVSCGFADEAYFSALLSQGADLRQSYPQRFFGREGRRGHHRSSRTGVRGVVRRDKANIRSPKQSINCSRCANHPVHCDSRVAKGLKAARAAAQSCAPARLHA
jgi:hypothetical protein